MEKYADFWENGKFKCSKCGAELFGSDAKFKSGTQWPSFRKAKKGAIQRRPDYSYGMLRTEILCAKCGQHLGHVLGDGKICGDTDPEAGNRFCVLSDSLKFENK